MSRGYNSKVVISTFLSTGMSLKISPFRPVTIPSCSLKHVLVFPMTLCCSGEFQWLACLSDTGVLFLMMLDCCIWLLGNMMDKEHMFADSLMIFVVFETVRFLFLSLLKMILTLFETDKLFRYRLPSSRSSPMRAPLHFLSCLQTFWKNCDSVFRYAIISLNSRSSISNISH